MQNLRAEIKDDLFLDDKEMDVDITKSHKLVEEVQHLKILIKSLLIVLAVILFLSYSMF